MNNYILPITLFLSIFFPVFFGIIKFNKRKKFYKSLKLGDKIVTDTGVRGKIYKLNETTAVIETMSGKLEIDKNTISIYQTSQLQKQ